MAESIVATTREIRKWRISRSRHITTRTNVTTRECRDYSDHEWENNGTIGKQRRRNIRWTNIVLDHLIVAFGKLKQIHVTEIR